MSSYSSRSESSSRTRRNVTKFVERKLPNYLSCLIRHPHLMLRHRDPHIVSFAPIDYTKHKSLLETPGYDFKTIDDYIDYLYQHNVIKKVEKLSNNKIIVWGNLLIDDHKNAKDYKREIEWKWGGYDICNPTTVDKLNEFITEQMFYMASNVIAIEQIFYTHVNGRNSFYSPYVITFDI